MEGRYDAEKFILFYDELVGSKAALPAKLYHDHLVKWGISPQRASSIIQMVDPKNTGYISRNDICRATDFNPRRLHALKDIKILSTDMPLPQRDSVAMLMLETVNQKMEKGPMLRQLKERLGNVYGGDWNCFIADGRYWSVCAHKPGTCLVFSYHKQVVGVYDSPEPV